MLAYIPYMDPMGYMEELLGKFKYGIYIYIYNYIHKKTADESVEGISLKNLSKKLLQ